MQMAQALRVIAGLLRRRERGKEMSGNLATVPPSVDMTPAGTGMHFYGFHVVCVTNPRSRPSRGRRNRSDDLRLEQFPGEIELTPDTLGLLLPPEEFQRRDLLGIIIQRRVVRTHS